MKNFNEFLSEAKKKAKKPKILKRLEGQLEDKGMSVGSAAAIARSTLQKSGVLKSGSQKLTKKGKKRQKMGAAGRAKDRAAKKSGRKASEYKYNPRNNQATLREDFIYESLLSESTRHIFSDFDGTLADDQSMIKVGDKKFTGVQFSSYVAKPGDPKPDFSEFRQLNQPKIEGKHFSFTVFKNAAAKLAKKKEAGRKDLPVLAIVTARPPEVVPHMRKWLKNNGIENADDVHIHAVGSSDPQAKVDAIRSHINSGRVKHGDQIHFFDDHGPNVEAIHGMREDHPEINIRSVRVGKEREQK